MYANLQICLSVYTFTLNRRNLQLRNLVQILEKVFEKIAERFLFLKNDEDFLKYFFKMFSYFCVQIILLFYDSLHLCLVLEAYSSEIWYRDTKEGFCKDLEAIFSKIILDYLHGRIKILNVCLDCKSRKN